MASQDPTFEGVGTILFVEDRYVFVHCVKVQDNLEERLQDVTKLDLHDVTVFDVVARSSATEIVQVQKCQSVESDALRFVEEGEVPSLV